MSNNYDYIVIGQGLAGSILAYRLIERGRNVLVIDNQHHGSSSKVAAGIINPITGNRLITNVLFKQQREISLDLYSELESLFTQKLVTELKQFRLLRSAEQTEFWDKRKVHSSYQDFVGESFATLGPFVDNDFEIVEIHKTLRIHTLELLSGFKKWFSDRHSYLAKKIDYRAIHISQNKVKIDSLESKNIIFCEGYQVIHNPWWNHLPFKLSKGEILKIQVDKPIDSMLNWRQWLVPDSNNGKELLLGTNYEWGDFLVEDSLQTSEVAKDYLLMSLEKNTNLKAKILEQQAGIRPTPTHRYPYMGSHKKLTNVFCFNGFGSKGCLTIPYYSELLANYLIDNVALPVDVTRWL